ncbi:MAG: hypothetical protein FLDDKLPJ_01392 [Phycisphaerae bacterium]|nr:hypothetical protein [Phycisphaerae bacterium]
MSMEKRTAAAKHGKQVPESSSTDDPVVAEVRAIRAKLWEEGGGTIEGFIELIRRRCAENQSPTIRPKGMGHDRKRKS